MKDVKKEKKNSFNKKEKNILIALIVSCFIILLSILGYTFAYFSATVTSTNKTQTILRAGSMILRFTGKTEINENSIVPGDKVVKTFEVENLTSIPTSYNIFFENTTNEFDEDLVFTLTDENGIVVTETAVPPTKSGKTYVKTGIEIAAQPAVHRYTLTIEYKYSATKNQSATKGSILRTTVGIDTEQIVADSWNVIDYTLSHDDNENADILTINNEDFYVLSKTSDKIIAFAKYNLNVGPDAVEGTSGIQNVDAANSRIAYTTDSNQSTYYDDAGYYTYKYLSNYPLRELYGDSYPADVWSTKRREIAIRRYVDNYITYLKNGSDTQSIVGRLANKSDLVLLGCTISASSASNVCDTSKPWAYSTTYHTSVALSNSYIGVITDSNSWYGNAPYLANAGLRPIIEIYLEKPSEAAKTSIAYTTGHDTTYDVDTVTIKNEDFYVMSNDGNKIVAIAKYNLRVGNQNGSQTRATYDNYEKQYNGAKGYVPSSMWSTGSTVNFSNYNYWSTEAGDYPRDVYMESPYLDGQYFNINYYLENYKDYLTNGANTNLSVRLITLDELKNGSTCAASMPCQDIPQYLDHMSYWTTTAGSAGSVYAFRAIESSMSDGNTHGMYQEATYYDNSSFGVRPVIEIDLN